MLINNSIIAGEILTLLEKEKRAVSLEELTYHLEEPFHNIQVGVERLVREGLVVLDVENEIVIVERMPNFEEQKVDKRKIRSDQLTFW